MKINEFTCKSCGKRVEVKVGSDQLIEETLGLKCPDCRLKEKKEKDERLLKAIFS